MLNILRPFLLSSRPEAYCGGLDFSDIAYGHISFYGGLLLSQAQALTYSDKVPSNYYAIICPRQLLGRHLLYLLF